jgi:hypothetical protein
MGRSGDASFLIKFWRKSNIICTTVFRLINRWKKQKGELLPQGLCVACYVFPKPW